LGPKNPHEKKDKLIAVKGLRLSQGVSSKASPLDQRDGLKKLRATRGTRPSKQELTGSLSTSASEKKGTE